MINGTLGIFKNVWGLVEKACSNLELSESDIKTIDSTELEKWNADLFSCRNSQLNMVRNKQKAYIEILFKALDFY